MVTMEKWRHGPLTGYVKLSVTHVMGMTGTFLPPRVSDRDMHHGTCMTYVPWFMPESLTSNFLCNRWRGRRSRHSRRMRNPQFYVSGKRPIGEVWFCMHPSTFAIDITQAYIAYIKRIMNPTYLGMLTSQNKLWCNYVIQVDIEDEDMLYILAVLTTPRLTAYSIYMREQWPYTIKSLRFGKLLALFYITERAVGFHCSW